MNRQFWSGRRVFITGHTGFKGSWLSLWLQSAGAQVGGFALPPPTRPSLFELARAGEGMESTFGDIRDAEAIASALESFQPEIVIHMAAQALVRPSYDDPVTTFATNVMGTVNLLNAVRNQKSVRAVINVTSDKCYENREWLWGYREHDSMGGYDPYSCGKGCAELVTSAFRSSFFNPEDYPRHGLALASARAGNVIGGGDWAVDRLIPDIIRAMAERREVVIRNPDAIRPWQHVLEPLSGCLALAEKLYSEGSRYAEGWNFGPRDEESKPVLWIVQQFIRIWGDGASYRVETSGSGRHEAGHLRLDSSKVHQKLGWKAHWDLDTTLAKVCHWHKALQVGSDMKSVTLEQIREYEAGQTN